VGDGGSGPYKAILVGDPKWKVERKNIETPAP